MPCPRNGSIRSFFGVCSRQKQKATNGTGARPAMSEREQRSARCGAHSPHAARPSRLRAERRSWRNLTSTVYQYCAGKPEIVVSWLVSTVSRRPVDDLVWGYSRLLPRHFDSAAWERAVCKDKHSVRCPEEQCRSSCPALSASTHTPLPRDSPVSHVPPSAHRATCTEPKKVRCRASL